MEFRETINDTSADAMTVQLDRLREMSPQRRMDLALAMTVQVRKMAFDAIRRRHPEFNDKSVKLRFIELVYGKALADAVAASSSENGE